MNDESDAIGDFYIQIYQTGWKEIDTISIVFYFGKTEFE